MKKRRKNAFSYPFFVPKTIRNLKFLTIIFIGLIQVSTIQLQAQNAPLKLSMRNVSLSELINALQKQTDFTFIYSPDDIKDIVIKNVEIENSTLQNALDKCLQGTNVGYEIVHKSVILKKQAIKPASKDQKTPKRIISGSVFDNKGQSLPGVNVIVQGTKVGTMTDAAGKFMLEVDDDAKILNVSFIGMKSQEIAVGKKLNFSIYLEEESFGISEVIVVGYGTQSKKTLTGAITNIDSKDILNTTSTSVAQKLQGKVAGLNIRQSSAEPGSFENQINIRGFGAPLYVIDGIARGDGKDFQRLNAEDIENISILKDASAAIYGLNAANGVIIVTTKKGHTGKTKFNFTSTTGYSTPVSGVRMMNAAEYVTSVNEGKINEGLPAPYSADELEKWQTGAPGYEGTNWLDVSFNKWAVRHENNLSASGGSDKVSFYLNGGIVDEGSILKNNALKYNRFNFRSNVNAKLTESLTANVNIGGFIDNKTEPTVWTMQTSGNPTNLPGNTDDFSSGTNYLPAVFNVWRGAVNALPIRTVYANNNPLYYQRINDGGGFNPIALQDPNFVGYNNVSNSAVQTTADFTYKVPFIKGLEIKGMASYDYRIAMIKTLFKKYLMYDYNAANETYVPTAFNDPSIIGNDWNYSHYLTLQAQASYKTTIAEKHNIAGTVVFESRDQGGRFQNLQMEYSFYTNDQISQASKTHVTPSGNEWQVRSMSYLGRFNYDYQGKYLLEFAGRYDGSYRYAPAVRWGFFPVLSGGWRVSEERFLKNNVSWLSNLKLRASIGKIGQDVGNPFQFVQGFSTSGGGNYEFSDGVLTYGAATPTMVNDNLTWMVSNIKDIGVDIGLFDEKLTFTADVYQRDRTGLLAYRNLTIPNTFGGTFPQENLNSDQVKGLEISFLFRDKIGDFNYNIGGNMNFARTKNIYVESAPFQSSMQQYVGSWGNRWSDMLWGFDNIGQFQSVADLQTSPIQGGAIGNGRGLPGDFKYADNNGDGVIDGNDQKPLFHNTTPTTNFGFTIGGTYKGFDFNFLFQGAAGNTVRYWLNYGLVGWAGSNIPAYFLDSWRMSDPNNPATSTWEQGAWPTIRFHDDGFSGSNILESSAWRRSADYVRLKNIELGYTVNQAFLRKIMIDKLRLYCNMTNVFTLASDPIVKQFDPESVSGFVSAGWNYPQNRAINLGVNINF